MAGGLCVAGGVPGTPPALWQGVCVAGGHAWQGGMRGRWGGVVVRILLECILVKVCSHLTFVFASTFNIASM